MHFLYCGILYIPSENEAHIRQRQYCSGRIVSLREPPSIVCVAPFLLQDYGRRACTLLIEFFVYNFLFGLSMVPICSPFLMFCIHLACCILSFDSSSSWCNFLYSFLLTVLVLRQCLSLSC